MAASGSSASEKTKAAMQQSAVDEKANWPDSPVQDRNLSLRPVAPVAVDIRDVTIVAAASAASASASAAIATPGSLASKLTRWRTRLLPKQLHGKARPSSEEAGRPSPRRLLDSISADLPAGTLTAILGASGSGKTSLLNVLADRLRDRKLDITGRILFNGSKDRSTVNCSYCMQQDVLVPTLTVRETLRFAANLRLRGDIPKEERLRIVEEVILELSLKEAADTRITYCSGGEKRRTSLAVQLLANPSVLFLDEPTTGLDATSAYQLVQTLKSLARKGRTVVLTVHQPRSEIWTLFDRIILLSQGTCVFANNTDAAVDHFSALDYPLPPFCNPAEHVIDLAAVDSRTPELELASQARVDKLKREWKDKSSDLFKTTSTKDLSQGTTSPGQRSAMPRQSSKAGSTVPLTRQIRVLTARTWLTTVRDPLGLIGIFTEAIFMGIIMGWIFYQLDGSLGGLRSRQAAMYVASALQGYLILMYETYRLSLVMDIFDRERSEGVVSAAGFMISRRLANFIEDVSIPLIFSIIFYFMTGFRTSGVQFGIFFAVLFLCQLLAINFASFAMAITRDFPVATIIGNLFFTWQTFSCGFFVLKDNMPVYVRWSRYTAHTWYAFGALSTNEFAGRVYDCPIPFAINTPECIQYTGAFQLKTFGIPPNWLWRPIVALLGFLILYTVATFVILQVFRFEMTVVGVRKETTDDSVGKERLRTANSELPTPVTIEVKDYELNVSKRTFQGFRPTTNLIPILKPVNAVFEPGKLNVIMGPSGSGKTSLLSSMANRLKNDLLSGYSLSGRLLINGAHPSKDVLQSIISYVTQGDDALLAKLTVRETLRLAARLRLPQWMTYEEKIQRAESILLQMGLKDCANRLIGSDKEKGISGGEKRRVTIAIQLLTQPRILLLDEPTSGLDGFTANSIMDVLKALAEQGRTIVMTIHQSRSDLWPSFGNVLLLARGGSTVYAGSPSAMIQHFASLGYKCPDNANPADFALDLITIDLRRKEDEAATRAKVQGLIDSWNKVAPKPEKPKSAVIATPAELGALKKSTASFLTAYPIITYRSWLNLRRQPQIMIAKVMQSLGLGIVATFFFTPLKTDYYSIQTRLGFIQEIAPVYFVGMLNNIVLYPFEQQVFRREFEDRVYNVEAFLLQYTTLELPFEIITSFVFAAMAIFISGLKRTAMAYFVVVFNVLVIVNCGESLGILFNTLLTHTGFAVNVMSVILSVAQIMGGAMAIDIPSFLAAFNYLSPVKYSLVSLAHIAFGGIEFSCLKEQRLADGSCPPLRGDDILKLYKFDMSLPTSLAGLAAVTVGYRLIAYVVLKAEREKWHNLLRKSRA